MIEEREGAQRSERNREEDHRSHLIHPDYKVRLRLSGTGESCLFFLSVALCFSSPLLI